MISSDSGTFQVSNNLASSSTSFMLNEVDIGWHLIVFFTIACGIGTSFMYGYSSGITSVPVSHVTNFINGSFGYEMSYIQIDQQRSLAVSLFLIGGTLGCILLPSFISNRFGFSRGILITSPIGLLGATLGFMSFYLGNVIIEDIGRFFSGFHSGLSLALVPGFLAEISPIALRGYCTGSTSILILAGMALGNLLGLPAILGKDWSWHYLYLVGICLYLLHIALMIFPNVTRSPAAGYKSTVFDFISSRALWHPLFLSINLALCLPFTGTPIVAKYSGVLFEDLGFGETAVKVFNFGFTTISLVLTIIVVVFIDKVGRKPILLASLFGCCLFLVLLTVSVHFGDKIATIVALALFQVSYAFGCGTVPWVMVVELFEEGSRGAALSITSFFIWIGFTTASLTSPYLLSELSEFSFLPFAGFSLFELTFFAVFLPETKNKSTVTIVKLLRSQTVFWLRGH